MSLVVAKVGGSLLDWVELPDRLGAWLDSRRSDRVVLIVGGGRGADWVRDLDRAHRLGDEKAHALAIRSLDFSAQVLAVLVDRLTAVDRVADLEIVWNSGRVPILTPRHPLREADPLPSSWDVTTDSIAARLADRLGAEELVLLKSADPPSGADRGMAVGSGLVDRFFPEAARGLDSVVVVNLRSSEPRPVPLPRGSPPDPR